MSVRERAPRTLSREGTKNRTLQDALLRLLDARRDADLLPTSHRFLFYELEQEGVVRKKGPHEKGRRGDQDLVDALLDLRVAGLVPWMDIVDESRAMASWRSAPTVADYLRDTLPIARIDCWGRDRPFVIAEAKTIGGVLQRRVAYEYLVPVAATSGQTHGFLMTEVVPFLRAWIANGVRPWLLVFSDRDLAGGMIANHTRRILTEELGAENFVWEPLAITDAQAADLQARGIEPIEKNDRRFKDGRGVHYAYEAEALGQAEIERLLRDRLDELIPEPIRSVRERERQQRIAALRALTRKGRA